MGGVLSQILSDGSKLPQPSKTLTSTSTPVIRNGSSMIGRVRLSHQHDHSAWTETPPKPSHCAISSAHFRSTPHPDTQLLCARTLIRYCGWRQHLGQSAGFTCKENAEMAISASFGITFQVTNQLLILHLSFPNTIVGLVVAKQALPPVEHRGQTMALLVDGNIKATFAAGAVPVKVEHLMYSKFALQVESIDTTLSLKWYARSLSLHEDLHLQTLPTTSSSSLGWWHLSQGTKNAIPLLKSFRCSRSSRSGAWWHLST